MSVEHAIELALDEPGTAAVRALLEMLDAAGVATIAGSSRHVHPHVSVAVARDGAPDELAHALAGLGPLATSLTPLTLSSLGVFVAPAHVVFLGVTPNDRMLALNRAVHERLDAARIETRALYRPSSWVPHCTLAMHVASPQAAIDALAGAVLPIHAAVSSLGVVEVPTGKPVAEVC